MLGQRRIHWPDIQPPCIVIGACCLLLNHWSMSLSISACDTKGNSLTHPAHTTHWTHVDFMLVQHRRRWANIGSTLAQCIVFTRNFHFEVMWLVYVVIGWSNDESLQRPLATKIITVHVMVIQWLLKCSAPKCSKVETPISKYGFHCTGKV